MISTSSTYSRLISTNSLLVSPLTSLLVVVSDYDADLELVDHGFAANGSDAAAKALWAGVDMSMQSGLYRQHLPDLVRQGGVAESVLDEAVRRVLGAKARMGLLDDPYRSLDAATEAAEHWVPAHDALARDAGRRSVVMLKNDGFGGAAAAASGVLPLRKKGQKVAVVGWWAQDRANAEGVGVIWGNESFAVTLAEGVAAALEDPGADLKVVNGSGVETVVSGAGGVAEAVAAAQWADVVVLALGEPKNYTGEAQSRTDITIPAAQMALAEAVAAAGKPVVVLLKNGRALELSGAVRDASAILVTWFLGKSTGTALADLLFGDFSPSGRLPVSFPVRSGQQPYFYNHASSGRPCTGKQPRRFKNCWREIGNEALYSFGHGLTYTSFSYGAPTFSSAGVAELPWDGSLTITSTVTNTGGERAGEEVVQLYIHDRVASRVRPVRELKGFSKISLEAGASADVAFTLSRHDLAFAVASPHGAAVSGNTAVVEPGMFDVWITSSATAGTASAFELLGPP